MSAIYLLSFIVHIFLLLLFIIVFLYLKMLIRLHSGFESLVQKPRIFRSFLHYTTVYIFVYD